MPPSSSLRATVTFDVGGTHQYRVSRSLLEQYPCSMLAVICSESWEQGATTTKNQVGADTIFIDRNGERFQYVLDYMRDSSVELPATITRAQFIKDLEYLGIDVRTESITVFVPMAVDLWELWGQSEERLAKRDKTVESRFRPIAIETMALIAEKKFRDKILQGKLATKSSSIRVSIREIVREPHVTKEELEAYLKPAGLKILYIVLDHGCDQDDDDEPDLNTATYRHRLNITMSFLE